MRRTEEARRERRHKLLRKKNETEQSVIEEYQNAGYGVIAKGWPDLLVFNDSEIFCVEIKRKPTRKKPGQQYPGLSLHQRKIHELLRRCGVKVIVRYQEQPRPQPTPFAEVIEAHA